MRIVFAIVVSAIIAIVVWILYSIATKPSHLQQQAHYFGQIKEVPVCPNQPLVLYSSAVILEGVTIEYNIDLDLIIFRPILYDQTMKKYSVIMKKDSIKPDVEVKIDSMWVSDYN